MKSSKQSAARAMRAAPAEAAGQFDAERGGKLEAAHALAQARALVEAINGVDGGAVRLMATFAKLAVRVPHFDYEALVVAAGAKSTKVFKRLATFAAERTVAMTFAARGAGERQEAAAWLVGRLRACVEAAALQRAMGRVFPAYLSASSAIDPAVIAMAACADAGVMARLQALAIECDVAPAANTRAVRAARRKVGAYGGAAVDAAQKKGAALPNVELLTKISWQVEVVDTPIGSTAKPAYVVRLDPNSPIGRLSRPPRPGEAPALEMQHVVAAQQVCALYFASMKSARLIGNYDGVVVESSSIGKRHPVEVACSSWAKLDGALSALLPIERRIVMDVAIYETPIHVLAARPGLVHFNKAVKAEAAVVQSLRCGLERLSATWGLAVGGPQDVPK